MGRGGKRKSEGKKTVRERDEEVEASDASQRRGRSNRVSMERSQSNSCAETEWRLSSQE